MTPIPPKPAPSDKPAAMSGRVMEVWSCGGGTQSGAIAVLIATGKLPRPDICLMVDTGRERASTWSFVDGFIRPQLAIAECNLVIIQSVEYASIALQSGTGTHLMPGFSNQNGGTGKLSAFCSDKWKKRVAMRYLRSVGVGQCRNWIGISLDEMSRVRAAETKWLQLWYPLVFDLRLRRSDCVEAIKGTGWRGDIPHSSCWMCPNHTDKEWLEMKNDYPDDFAAACHLEAALHVDDPNFFLHRSCAPLGLVVFESKQADLFGGQGCAHGGCYT